MEQRRLSAQDALWLTMDRPNNLMVIDVAVVLDGDPGLERLRELFTLLAERHPVFASRAESGLLGWSWVPDPAFDIGTHVRAVDLPEGSGMDAVQRHVAEQRSVPLERDRPLWTATLLRPVVLDDGKTGSVVLTRFHHAIADGVRLTQVMLAMLDPAYASSVPRIARSGASTSVSVAGAGAMAREAARLAAGASRSLAGTVGQAISDPVGAVTGAPDVLSTGFGMIRHPDRLVDVLQSLGAADHRVVNDATAASKLAVGGTTRTVWTGRPGQRKAVAWSSPIPLDAVKAVARRHRATLNDVLVAALAGAVRRYLEGRGDVVDQVTWMVPVNLEPFSADLPEDLGNHFALVMLDMPLTGASPRDRILDQRHRMRRIKNSDEPIMTFGMQRAISMSPGRMATVLTDFFAGKAVGILTNVPGPTRPLSLDDMAVRQIIGFAPCSGDQPLTATIFTYAGTVTVGFASDADLVPDPQTLVGLVASELEAMAEIDEG